MSEPVAHRLSPDVLVSTCRCQDQHYCKFLPTKIALHLEVMASGTSSPNVMQLPTPCAAHSSLFAECDHATVGKRPAGFLTPTSPDFQATSPFRSLARVRVAVFNHFMCCGSLKVAELLA